MPSHANPVNWFEIPVTDMSRARAFYEAVLAVEITEAEMGPKKMGWFPMQMDAAGSAGTLIHPETAIRRLWMDHWSTFTLMRLIQRWS